VNANDEFYRASLLMSQIEAVEDAMAFTPGFPIWLTLESTQNFCELEFYEKRCCEEGAKRKNGVAPESLLLRIGHHEVEVHCASVEPGRCRLKIAGGNVINSRYIHQFYYHVYGCRKMDRYDIR
jgi:hypothetical protein